MRLSLPYGKTEDDSLIYNENMNNTAPATQGAEPIENAVLAMAYVPMQMFGNLYDSKKGLQAGTIFADLDKPFCGRGVKQ